MGRYALIDIFNRTTVDASGCFIVCLSMTFITRLTRIKEITAHMNIAK